MMIPEWDKDIQQWQSMIDHIPDIVLTIDRDGVILFASTVRHGFDAATLVGTEAASFLPADERAAFAARIAQVFTAHESCEYEIRGKSPDGSATHYLNIMSPVVQDGAVIAANILSRDFTSRAHARQRIINAFEREQRNTERLMAIDREQRDFTAKVIHDMRTPITVIDGFARTLTDPHVNVSDSQAHEFLRLMSEASQRLVLLTDDILEMYRIEQPDMYYSISPVDLIQSVRSSVESFGNRAHRVTIVEPDQRIWVMADDRRHQQVCINLLSNALKYAPQGSITITVTCDEHQAHVSISDEGPGIPAEYHPMLFRKFFQVPGRENAHRGSGLGLYICKALIEAQHGTIAVASTPGIGTTFTYSLPVIAGS